MTAAIDYYNYIFHEMADKRTNDYLLGDSPLLVLGIVIAYYYFVEHYGPKLMKNRLAFNIDRLLIVYNIIQITVNAYICGTVISFAHRLNLVCDLVDYSESDYGRLSVHLGWFYFIDKVLDLLDTIFFVLRKKQNQVTFLHVYHHILMVLSGWLGFRYVSGGHTVYFGLLNTTVHTVMYFYYLLTVYNSQYKKNVWWKKHITQLQMTQFVVICAIYIPLIFRNDCNYPKFFAVLLVTQSLMMLYMFSKFYYNAYIKCEKIMCTSS